MKRPLGLLKSGKAIPICPEQLGGLPTPRVPAEQRRVDGKITVINKEGKDVTAEFEKGAREVLKFCKKLEIEKVILQPRSPSCGVGQVYSGEFNGTLVEGDGITAKLLKENGIEVVSIDDI